MAVLLTLFCATQVIANEKDVSLAVLNWQPYVGEKLDNFGFGAEILIEAFERAGYKAKLNFMPWARALKDTEAGKYDAVCFGYYSEKRARIYALSNPFAKSILGFYKQKDSDIFYTNLQNLKPYRIGVVRSYVNTAEFDAADYLKKEEVNSEMLNLKKLLNKRVDLILIDKFVGQFLINTSFQKNKSDFEFIEPPLKIQPMYVMFSIKIKNYEHKLKDFNIGLKQIADDGTIIKIMAKHGFK